MRAMLLEAAHVPLRAAEIASPHPAAGDLLIVDGELTRPTLPLVLGHEIVGRVVELGAGASRFAVGARVGVPWLGWTDGSCRYCLAGRENLCDHPRFTGYDRDGGYAEYTVADERFCFALPEGYGDAET